MQQKQSSGKKLKKLKDENECAFDKKKSVELQEIQLWKIINYFLLIYLNQNSINVCI